MPAAVACLKERAGFVTQSLGEKVIRSAVQDVVKGNNAQMVGWGMKPPRNLHLAMADTFPRRAGFMVALRCVFVCFFYVHAMERNVCGVCVCIHLTHPAFRD